MRKDSLVLKKRDSRLSKQVRELQQQSFDVLPLRMGSKQSGSIVLANLKSNSVERKIKIKKVKLIPDKI